MRSTPVCPHLVIETTTRHIEAGGCVSGDGMRDPRSPEPSTSRFEAVYRVMQLLPQPRPSVAPGLPL